MVYIADDFELSLTLQSIRMDRPLSQQNAEASLLFALGIFSLIALANYDSPLLYSHLLWCELILRIDQQHITARNAVDRNGVTTG